MIKLVDENFVAEEADKGMPDNGVDALYEVLKQHPPFAQLKSEDVLHFMVSIETPDALMLLSDHNEPRFIVGQLENAKLTVQMQEMMTKTMEAEQ